VTGPLPIRRLDEATHQGSRRLTELMEELRRARRLAGLGQRSVGRALGVSAAWVCRAERGYCRGIPIALLARWAAVVGLSLRVSLYPLGSPIRDAPQLALIGRLQRRLHPTWRVRAEAPVRVAGDLRAADLLLTRPGCSVVIEAVTRLTDVQAQLRAANLKQRDLGATRVILLLSDTQLNRFAIRAAAGVLEAEFPLRTRAAMAALGAGRDPGGNALVML